MTASAGTCLPDPTAFVSDENAVGMTSPSIKLTIERIAQFVVTVRRQKLYLSKSTILDELLDWHASNRHTYQVKYDAAALSQEQSPAGFDQNVLAFSIPKFIGDRIKRQELVDNVMRKFKGHGQLSYLEDTDFCDNHPGWSEAFSSCLLDSLAENDILGYQLTELKDEGNCAEVWEKFTTCLHTSELTMARIMQHWSDFFALHCTSMDEFPFFYSGVKKITHKLREADSIAITDDTFLKTFLSSSMSCEDLKTESKSFLMEGTETHNKIMDNIHGDYCAQTSGEQMRVDNSLLTK